MLIVSKLYESENKIIYYNFNFAVTWLVTMKVPLMHEKYTKIIGNQIEFDGSG